MVHYHVVEVECSRERAERLLPRLQGEIMLTETLSYADWMEQAVTALRRSDAPKELHQEFAMLQTRGDSLLKAELEQGMLNPPGPLQEDRYQFWDSCAAWVSHATTVGVGAPEAPEAEGKAGFLQAAHEKAASIVASDRKPAEAREMTY